MSFAAARLVFALALLGGATFACGGGEDEAPEASPAATGSVAASSASAGPGAATQPAGTPTASATVETFPAPELERQLGTRTDTPHRIREPSFEALPGATAHFGILGEAAYRVEIPEDWNGDLVLYAHGVRLQTDELTVSNPIGPLRDALIGDGFAWAASSFSENFYVPGIGADDTLALLRHFETQFGEPENVYLVGESMGGNVVTLLMEHYPAEWAGALSVCGAIGGQEQIDFLLSWVLAAELTSGVAMPVGEPIPDFNALATAVLRALGPPGVPTPLGLQFQGVIRELTGGPRPFFGEGFAAQFQMNFGLLALDPERETLPTAAASNLDTVYAITEGLGLSNEDVNAAIRRIGPVGDARNAELHPDAVPTTGNITAPFLTLHNTGDLFVPISLEVAYRAKVAGLGKSDLLVQRAIRASGHCQFSDEEYLAAWEDLVAWVRAGTKPAGDDLSGSLADIGRAFTNPLRAGDPGIP